VFLKPGSVSMHSRRKLVKNWSPRSHMCGRAHAWHLNFETRKEVSPLVKVKSGGSAQVFLLRTPKGAAPLPFPSVCIYIWCKFICRFNCTLFPNVISFLSDCCGFNMFLNMIFMEKFSFLFKGFFCLGLGGGGDVESSLIGNNNDLYHKMEPLSVRKCNAVNLL